MSDYGECGAGVLAGGGQVTGGRWEPTEAYCWSGRE